MDDEEEDDEEEVLLLLLVVVVDAVVELDGLGGGAPWGATGAGGISKADAWFMCPVNSPGRDRGATWDTGDERVPWLSPTPSVFLHATIAISTVSKTLRAQLSSFYSKINAQDLPALITNCTFKENATSPDKIKYKLRLQMWIELMRQLQYNYNARLHKSRMASHPETASARWQSKKKASFRPR